MEKVGEDKSNALSQGDISQTRRATRWMEQIMDSKLEPQDDFLKALRDGFFLCKLIQSMTDDLIKTEITKGDDNAAGNV